ncbi:MAG: hypothetical protein Q7K65_01045, partial [Candidatus Buchananbacteria bacterium]|nr:hypothetical protein [Candidatus Buchananbacteria bacterium]
MNKFIFLIIIFVFIAYPDPGKAEDILGQSLSFNIEPDYDLTKRSQLTAVLIKISPKVYWYLDNEWWKSINQDQQNQVKESLNLLAEVFETKIYPLLTAA